METLLDRGFLLFDPRQSNEPIAIDLCTCYSADKVRKCILFPKEEETHLAKLLADCYRRCVSNEANLNEWLLLCQFSHELPASWLSSFPIKALLSKKADLRLVAMLSLGAQACTKLASNRDVIYQWKSLAMQLISIHDHFISLRAALILSLIAPNEISLNRISHWMTLTDRSHWQWHDLSFIWSRLIQWNPHLDKARPIPILPLLHLLDESRLDSLSVTWRWCPITRLLDSSIMWTIGISVSEAVIHVVLQCPRKMLSATLAQWQPVLTTSVTITPQSWMQFCILTGVLVALFKRSEERVASRLLGQWLPRWLPLVRLWVAHVHYLKQSFAGESWTLVGDGVVWCIARIVPDMLMQFEGDDAHWMTVVMLSTVLQSSRWFSHAPLFDVLMEKGNCLTWRCHIETGATLQDTGAVTRSLAVLLSCANQETVEFSLECMAHYASWLYLHWLDVPMLHCKESTWKWLRNILFLLTTLCRTVLDRPKERLNSTLSILTTLNGLFFIYQYWTGPDPSRKESPNGIAFHWFDQALQLVVERMQSVELISWLQSHLQHRISVPGQSLSVIFWSKLAHLALQSSALDEPLVIFLWSTMKPILWSKEYQEWLHPIAALLLEKAPVLLRNDALQYFIELLDHFLELNESLLCRGVAAIGSVGARFEPCSSVHLVQRIHARMKTSNAPTQLSLCRAACGLVHVCHDDQLQALLKSLSELIILIPKSQISPILKQTLAQCHLTRRYVCTIWALEHLAQENENATTPTCNLI